MSERVRNVNSTDTLRTGAAEAGADPDDENRIDFGTLFPAKGDSRRPPEWFGRALLYVALAVIVFMFCWRSWGDISYLVLDIIISLFLALAVEPLVVALVAHGWKRGVASAVSLVGVAVVVGVLLTLFGNMFVQQMIAMVRGLPAMYEQIREFVDQYATFKMPEISNLGMEIFNNIQTSWVTDFAGTRKQIDQLCADVEVQAGEKAYWFRLDENGEVVGGIHGRNRLMGNSLLDVIVFGRNAGQHAAEKAKSVTVGALTLDHVAAFEAERKAAGIDSDLPSPRLLPDYTRKTETL